MKYPFRTFAILILAILSMFLFYFTFQPFDEIPKPSPQEKVRVSLQTDKSRYNPGEAVSFSLHSEKVNKGVKAVITYYHLNRMIKKEEVPVTGNSTSWKWMPPSDDFQGYLVSAKLKKGQTAIAVDVSSTWTKFPRYGFLSDFSNQSPGKMRELVNKLNRYHLNGLQFYDWQYQHNDPLPIQDGQPLRVWEDVAGRQVSFQTLEHYLSLAKEKNISSMAYNLLYGSFEHAGAEKGWQLYKDTNHTNPDIHPLPDDWKSNIQVMNSNDRGWQDFLIEKQQEAFRRLPFDGWHIDQLGSRGPVYDWNGHPVDLADGFDEFLHYTKSKMPEKDLVMNAVNQYGQDRIASSPADFLYTEVWDENKYYGNLKQIIDRNTDLSGGRKNTVLAAYMDYKHSDQKGLFNEAGILQTDSVIFASGGSHLELGEHMLSKEYFPHNNLTVSPSLESRLISYYDFAVAYETLLRGEGLKEEECNIHSNDIQLSQEPKKGAVWTFSKRDDDRSILHFLNFSSADSLEWRDTVGTQKAPQLLKGVTVTAEANKKVKSVWTASPDEEQGLPVKVPFTQSGNTVSFTLPSLEYWRIAVLEEQ